MSKYIYSLFCLVIILLSFSCSDDIAKVPNLTDDIRIEYSKCTACLECIDDFKCPQKAIVLDKKTNMVCIDYDKCTQCMKCVDIFDCRFDAFTTKKDTEAPSDITNFSALSDSIGKLSVSFTAPGDDQNEGNAYGYFFELNDKNGILLSESFQDSVPKTQGETEKWTFYNLPHYQKVFLNLFAFDECSNNSSVIEREIIITGPEIDSIPPAPIADLRAIGQEETIKLIWTAPGDDNNEGSCASYDIRYAKQEITETNWLDAAKLLHEISPSSAGAEELYIIKDFPVNEEYYFTIKAVDEKGNISAISNNAAATVTGDITPPSKITNLSSPNSSTTTIQLTWTAPGDSNNEGTASRYIIKISELEITTENWNEIPEYQNSLIPQPAGSVENIIIENLNATTDYFAAIKAADEVENISEISNIIKVNTAAIPDTQSPASITDLTAFPAKSSLILSWTAPGDDGNTGTAAQYIVKKSLQNITEENWQEAETISNPPLPQVSGTKQSITISDIENDKDCYFAIKTEDESANISPISNIAIYSPVQDTTAPAGINDLSLKEGYTTSSSSIQLQWTAPGDDNNEGTAARYEIRYAEEVITDTNWESAALLTGSPTPENAGTSQSVQVSGLTKGVIYYFAIKTFDEAENSSIISNLPFGKIVYFVNSSCRSCGRCYNKCDTGALTVQSNKPVINPDLCDACGDCANACPWNYIKLYVIAYE